MHALPVSSVATFAEYADSKFLPFLENHLKSTKRIDVVWDQYRVASLKESAREKRGKGVSETKGSWACHVTSELAGISRRFL